MGDSLFVHGTLADPACFRTVAGKELPRRPAVLPGFRRIAAPPAFPHLVPQNFARTEGLLVETVDARMLEHLDHYERNGHLYSRQAVTVWSGGTQRPAYAYVGDPGAIAAHCDPDLQPSERLERHLDEQVDGILARSVAADAGSDAALLVRAHREVLGSAIEDACRSRLLGSSGSADEIRRTLKQARLPDLAWLDREEGARRFAGTYLRLVARLVVLSQVEERIRTDFRSSVRVPAPYYRYTLSLLAALAFLNPRAAALEEEIGTSGLGTYRRERGYLDTVREALLLADALYDREGAAEAIAQIRERRQEGATPLGAELEFSHLGPGAVGARAGADPQLDSFFYFHDFDLARRLWKAGGHRDDHTGASFDEGRSRGFLEVAIGRLQVGEDYACPATADVWVLAELIREAVAFVGIPPHSLHVSMQVDPARPFACLDGPEPLFCLLLLGGDLGLDQVGILRERRIHGREIVSRHSRLEFSRLKTHRSHAGQASPAQVVEFAFPRLAGGVSYEPLILALKGFQWADNPAPLDPAAGEPYRRHCRAMVGALKCWAETPRPVSDGDIRAFLQTVERGLERERATGAGHSPAYVADSLARIEAALAARNRAVRAKGPA